MIIIIFYYIYVCMWLCVCVCEWVKVKWGEAILCQTFIFMKEIQSLFVQIQFKWMYTNTTHTSQGDDAQRNTNSVSPVCIRFISTLFFCRHADRPYISVSAYSTHAIIEKGMLSQSVWFNLRFFCTSVCLLSVFSLMLPFNFFCVLMILFPVYIGLHYP